MMNGRTAAVGFGEDLGGDDVRAVGVLDDPHRRHVAPGQPRGVGTFADEDDEVEGLGGELGRALSVRCFGDWLA